MIFYWGTVTPWIRVHEFKHVEQRKRYGFVEFVKRYVLGMRDGYRMNELEAESYATLQEPLPAWALSYVVG